MVTNIPLEANLTIGNIVVIYLWFGTLPTCKYLCVLEQAPTYLLKERRKTLSNHSEVRFKWLRGMYIYTIVGAGGFGLGMLFAPGLISLIFGIPLNEPIVYGIAGSTFLAFAIASIFGLFSPLKYVPVLFLQLCYKSAWFLFIVIPLLFTGQFPPYALVPTIIFATYIIGDIIAIPFKLLFAKDK